SPAVLLERVERRMVALGCAPPLHRMPPPIVAALFPEMTESSIKRFEPYTAPPLNAWLPVRTQFRRVSDSYWAEMAPPELFPPLLGAFPLARVNPSMSTAIDARPTRPKMRLALLPLTVTGGEPGPRIVTESLMSISPVVR